MKSRDLHAVRYSNVLFRNRTKRCCKGLLGSCDLGVSDSDFDLKLAWKL